MMRGSIHHNGETTRSESGWTWECSCGEMESASTKAECEKEWKSHQSKKAYAVVGLVHGDMESEAGKSLSEDQVKRKIIRAWNRPEQCELGLKIRSNLGLP